MAQAGVSRLFSACLSTQHLAIKYPRYALMWRPTVFSVSFGFYICFGNTLRKEVEDYVEIADGVHHMSQGRGDVWTLAVDHHWLWFVALPPQALQLPCGWENGFLEIWCGFHIPPLGGI